MDPSEMMRRASTARVGHLATVGDDGRPHIVPLCFVVLGDTVYSAIDHKPKATTRLKRLANVRATRHATVLVDHYDDEAWSRLWWIRMDGTARVLDEGQERDEAVMALVAKYPQYAERVPAGPVLAIDVATYRAWEATGLG